MPCNQTCGYSNNCTWIIILAFIVIWFFCGYHGNSCGGCASPCGGCGGCGC